MEERERATKNALAFEWVHAHVYVMLIIVNFIAITGIIIIIYHSSGIMWWHLNFNNVDFLDKIIYLSTYFTYVALDNGMNILHVPTYVSVDKRLYRTFHNYIRFICFSVMWHVNADGHIRVKFGAKSNICYRVDC